MKSKRQTSKATFAANVVFKLAIDSGSGSPKERIHFVKGNGQRFHPNQSILPPKSVNLGAYSVAALEAGPPCSMKLDT